MLSINNFTKSYHHRLILEIPELELQHGIFWLKGKNGSGKSTLLKAVAGVISFQGNIVLGQHTSLKKQPIAYRKLVNFAEAEPVFPEFLTGKEMVKLFSHAKEAPTGQDQRFVESMNLSSYINEPIGTYSSGMLKKLSLVLAFIGNPKLILLDEPMITVDLESLKILYQWIVEKHREQGVSFLLSSHQPLEVEGLASTKELLIEEQSVKFKAR